MKKSKAPFLGARENPTDIAVKRDPCIPIGAMTGEDVGNGDNNSSFL